MPSHYLNQCWVIVNLTLTNKRQWYFNQNTKLFIHENASENIVCEMAASLSREGWLKVRVWISPYIPHKTMGCYYNGVIMSVMASQITCLTIVYLIVYSDADQRKHQSVTGLCEGNSPVTGEFPAQRTSNAENVSIWWRHHGVDKFLYPTQNYGM